MKHVGRELQLEKERDNARNYNDRCTQARTGPRTASLNRQHQHVDRTHHRSKRMTEISGESTSMVWINDG